MPKFLLGSDCCQDFGILASLDNTVGYAVQWYKNICMVELLCLEFGDLPVGIQINITLLPGSQFGNLQKYLHALRMRMRNRRARGPYDPLMSRFLCPSQKYQA